MLCLEDIGSCSYSEIRDEIKLSMYVCYEKLDSEALRTKTKKESG